jgi:hypothetical protein
MKAWKDIEIEQRQVCELNKIDWQAFDRSKLIAINESIYEGIEPINGIRYNDLGTIGGWYLWCGGEIPQDQVDFFKPLHVEHLLQDLPECLKYLGLPSGWRFQIDRNGYEDLWFEPELLEI